MLTISSVNGIWDSDVENSAREEGTSSKRKEMHRKNAKFEDIAQNKIFLIFLGLFEFIDFGNSTFSFSIKCSLVY